MKIVSNAACIGIVLLSLSPTRPCGDEIWRRSGERGQGHAAIAAVVERQRPSGVISVRSTKDMG